MRRFIFSLLLVLLTYSLPFPGHTLIADTVQASVGDQPVGSKQKHATKKSAPAGTMPKPEQASTPSSVSPTYAGVPARVARVRDDGPCDPACSEWIAIDGPLDAKAAQRLGELIKVLDGQKLPIFLNSPGGNFDAALEMGSMIRSHGLATAIGEVKFTFCEPGQDCSKYLPPAIPLRGRVRRFGKCDRECLFVLAGGVKRWDVAAVSTLVAPMSSLVTGEPGKFAARRASSYLRAMGVSADVLKPAPGGPSGEPVWLSDADRHKLGFGNKAALPVVLADSRSCKTSAPLPNCVRRTPRVAPSPGAKAVVARMRAVEGCEPRCPEWIMVRGRITPQTSRQFAAVLGTLDQKDRAPIILDSPGGDLDAAIEMGRMIRAKTFTTAVAGNLLLDCDPQEKSCSRGRSAAQPYRAYLLSSARCDGECLFVLAGGTKRFTNWLSSAELPPMSSFTTRRKGVTPAAVIGRYLEDMSLSPRLAQLLIAANSVPTRLSRQDITNYRLGNFFESDPDLLSDPARCKWNAFPQNWIFRADDDD